MARIETYREAIEAVIRDYASVKPAFGDIDMEAVTDRTHDHYEVMMMGWDNHERVHTSLIHIDIINNKVWIQHDATDVGIADEDAPEVVEAAVKFQLFARPLAQPGDSLVDLFGQADDVDQIVLWIG